MLEVISTLYYNYTAIVFGRSSPSAEVARFLGASLSSRTDNTRIIVGFETFFNHMMSYNISIYNIRV